jgi:hypothetical protein
VQAVLPVKLGKQIWFNITLCMFNVKQAVTLFRNTRVTTHRVSKSVLASVSIPCAKIGYVLHITVIYNFWHAYCYWFCVLCGTIQCWIYVYNIYISYLVIFSRDVFNIYSFRLLCDTCVMKYKNNNIAYSVLALWNLKTGQCLCCVKQGQLLKCWLQLKS